METTPRLVCGLFLACTWRPSLKETSGLRWQVVSLQRKKARSFDWKVDKKLELNEQLGPCYIRIPFFILQEHRQETIHVGLGRIGCFNREMAFE